MTTTEPSQAAEGGWDAARDRITEVNEAIRAERERIREGLAELGRRRPPFIYFGRDVAAVLDGED